MSLVNLLILRQHFCSHFVPINPEERYFLILVLFDGPRPAATSATRKVRSSIQDVEQDSMVHEWETDDGRAVDEEKRQSAICNPSHRVVLSRTRPNQATR
jgi:hypothetical protein